MRDMSKGVCMYVCMYVRTYVYMCVVGVREEFTPLILYAVRKAAT